MCLRLAPIRRTHQPINIAILNLYSEVVPHAVLTVHMATAHKHNTMSTKFLQKTHLTREALFFKLSSFLMLVIVQYSWQEAILAGNVLYGSGVPGLDRV